MVYVVVTVQIKIKSLAVEACVETGTLRNYTVRCMVERILREYQNPVRLMAVERE